MTYLEHKDLGPSERRSKTPFLSTSANLEYLLAYSQTSKRGSIDYLRYVYHFKTKGIAKNFFDASKLLVDKLAREELEEQREFGTRERIPWKNIFGWNIVYADGSVYYFEKDAWLKDRSTKGTLVREPSKPKTAAYVPKDYYMGLRANLIHHLPKHFGSSSS
ncbi:hypothetical protein PspLS_01625 [Pyricularia sp. CBS 133598]|nr:hypothetical protein PspLS_01625 [Pyricularia sp. CBS 133598]